MPMSLRKSTRKVSNYFADEEGVDENGNIDSGEDYEPEIEEKKKRDSKASTSQASSKRKKVSESPLKNGVKIMENKKKRNEDDNNKSKTHSNKKIVKPKKKSSLRDDDEEDDDDDDDWEDVQEADIFDLDDYQPSVPKNIKVNLDKPKSKKKEYSFEHYIRLRMNQMIRKNQLNVHRTHLLTLIAHIRWINSIINSDLVKALVLSLKSASLPKPKGKVDKLMESLKKWIHKHFTINVTNEKHSGELTKTIIGCFESKTINSNLQLVIIATSILRLVGYYARVSHSLHPCHFKSKDEDLIREDTKFIRRIVNSTQGNELDEGVSLTCDKSNPFIKDAQENEETPIFFYWIEIYDELNGTWVPWIFSESKNSSDIAPEMGIVCYALSIDNDNYVNDVTARYAPDYTSNNMKKKRLDDDWWKETMDIVKRPELSKYEHADNKQFDLMMSSVELPKRVSDYKNHPLFVLQKDILKFQAIYPPNAPTVGFFREHEPVFSRNCVHTLKSRETWLKEARTVKMNETAYKVVEARFANKRTGRREPLDLFGEWQTKPYEPPVAKDGIVPRNAYGNVEVFKECMLPIGTVRLRLPGLGRIASKLKIDCAEAVVGFDAHKRSGVHAVLDGFVVCTEFKDTLIDAWKQENQISAQKQKEKREKQIMDNWKTLIKGIIIKHNLKVKYGD